MEGGDTVAAGFTPEPVLVDLYPEAAAGGFTRHDGFVEFYARVNALLTPESEVLDFGAGRGQWAASPLPPLSKQLRSFHQRVRRVVGVDVDPVVRENPTLAEAKVMEPKGPIPYDDESFDLVLADYVLEHVAEEDAATVASELMRVLRPNGWLAARTPNKWGMIGIGARAVPNRLHARVLSRLQPGRQERDVFPVRYHMNTRGDLRRLFPAPHQVIVYGHAPEPAYMGTSRTAWRLAAFADRLTPPPFQPILMVLVRKRG